MIKAIKLFFLKRKIGYKKQTFAVNKCFQCLAYRKGRYCDRYKFDTYCGYSTCNHFVPGNNKKPLSEKDRAEIEQIKTIFESLFCEMKKWTGAIK